MPGQESDAKGAPERDTMSIPNQITAEEELNLLRAENAALKAAAKAKVKYGVSEKGLFSIRGFRKWPFCYFLEETESLIEEFESGRFKDAFVKLRPEMVSTREAYLAKDAAEEMKKAAMKAEYLSNQQVT